jgi:phosphate:Na+ symporter
VALAAFHTSFIALGVAIFLPFTRQFARVIERILPDEELPLTRHLDPSLHTVPAVALEAGRNALRSIAGEHCQQIERLLQGQPETIAASREKILHAIEETRHFLAAVPLAAGEEATRGKRVALFHALDHLSQMVALPLVSAAPRIPNQNTPAEPMVKLTLEALQVARQMFENKEPDGRIRELEELSRKAAEQRKGDRRTMLESVSTGEHEGGAALKILDYIRWLDSAVYHAWRIVFYLDGGLDGPGETTPSNNAASPSSASHAG